MEGTIKNLNEKGFGFVTPKDGGKDVFFHRSDLVDTQFNDLHKGQEVTFEMGDSDKGPKAINVSIA